MNLNHVAKEKDNLKARSVTSTHIQMDKQKLSILNCDVCGIKV